MKFSINYKIKNIRLVTVLLFVVPPSGGLFEKDIIAKKPPKGGTTNRISKFSCDSPGFIRKAIDIEKMMSYYDIINESKIDVIVVKELTMKAITIRNVEPSMSSRLKEEAKIQGKSVNQYLIDMIKQNLGLQKKKRYSNEYHDLDDLFGKWSDKEYQQIQGKIDGDRKIDKELWE